VFFIFINENCNKLLRKQKICKSLSLFAILRKRLKPFQPKVVDKIKTAFYVHYLFFENRAEYKIMWKNIVEPNKSQMTMARAH
jgi:hypothetical protein